ncbi:hypothetical protein MK489_02845, partial [Myxococcota bacterium]|nr:hypothetical protein [Myxococcota bacterium]
MSEPTRQGWRRWMDGWWKTGLVAGLLLLFVWVWLRSGEGSQAPVPPCLPQNCEQWEERLAAQQAVIEQQEAELDALRREMAGLRGEISSLWAMHPDAAAPEARAPPPPDAAAPEARAPPPPDAAAPEVAAPGLKAAACLWESASVGPDPVASRAILSAGVE